MTTQANHYLRHPCDHHGPADLSEGPAGHPRAAIPAALAATGVINASSAYTEFGNTTIVFFMGLVVVGEAFFKTGLADFIGGKIIGLLGKTEKGLLLVPALWPAACPHS